MSTLPPNPSPNPSFQPKPVKPRKVRGGIKLASETGAYPESWAAQRWLRLVEQAAPGAAMVAGLEYAKLGQTRTMALEPGWIRGSVQGTVISAYRTSIALPTLAHDQSERVVAAMVDQAVYAAKLLAGELPANIEDVFAPLGLRLFPTDPAELVTKCNCRDVAPPPTPGGMMGMRRDMSGMRPGQFSLNRGQSAGQSQPAIPTAGAGTATPPAASPSPGPAAAGAPGGAATPVAPVVAPARGGWCKHACCLAYLVAEKLTTDPFLIFTLRGLPREELLEGLRQRRAVAGAGQGPVLVYSPLVPGVSDVEPAPLEECVGHFWEAGPELDALDLPLGRPEVSHPLLRRLGPSPFGAGGGKFPLVGLLATCYEVISEAAVKAEEAGTEVDVPVPEGDDEGGPEDEPVRH